MPASDTPAPEESGGPVIHDNRRIDPVTGQARRGKHAASKPAGTTGAGRPGGGPANEPEAASAPGLRSDERSDGATREGADMQRPQVSEPEIQPQVSEPEDTELRKQLEERTSDLQRLQAEYANYRKRVDRDRASVKEQAVAATLTGLLPVLDAIDQARDHGELSGGFKSVADQLQAAVSRLGLTTYGEKGDPFDPKIHEALTSTYSADVTEDTCVEILQPGYKVGDRILRAARVAVAEPATGPDGASNEASWPSPDEEGN
jgi:molecular chaperone GrpE